MFAVEHDDSGVAEVNEPQTDHEPHEDEDDQSDDEQETDDEEGSILNCDFQLSLLAWHIIYFSISLHI